MFKVTDYLPSILFLSMQKKPDPKKTVFENYVNHLYCLGMNTKNTFYEFDKSPNKLEFATKQVAKRCTMFNALQDGYDYADEVAGATLVKYMGMMASLGLVAFALLEGANALAIYTGFTNNDSVDHKGRAITCCLAAVATIALTTLIFTNAAINLVSRPIATAIHGYKETTESRFYDKGLKELTEGLSNIKLSTN